mgnify:CR=1 FL=1
MAKKQRKEALAALDRANKEYKNICDALKDKYTELDNESDAAIELISDVETLVESVRRRPWSYKTMKKKIAVCKKNFIDSKELKRKERNKNITVDIVAGGVAVGGLTLIAFYKKMFKKNIVLFIVCLALIVFVAAGRLIFKRFNRIKTTKKAYAQYQLLAKETYENKGLLTQADGLLKKIQGNAHAVRILCSELSKFHGNDFKELPEKTKDKFTELYNLTCALAELVNTQIG